MMLSPSRTTIWRVLTALGFSLALVATVGVGNASAHGAISDPPSRAYDCYTRWASEWQSPDMATEDIALTWKLQRRFYDVRYEPRALIDMEVPATFARFNVYHDGELDQASRLIRDQLAPRVVYARFFVHALEDDGRLNLWRLSSRILAAGGRGYFEFRVAETEHEFGEHYRRFVAPDLAVREVERSGAVVEHLEEGHGLARYKNEDPRVCRMVARW
jgi:hypothetical protein